MGKSNVINVTFKMTAEANDLNSKLGNFKKQLDGLKVSDKVKQDLSNMFDDATKKGKKFSETVSKGFSSQNDVQKAQREFNAFGTSMENLERKMKDLGLDSKKFLPDDLLNRYKKLESLQEELINLQKKEQKAKKYKDNNEAKVKAIKEQIAAREKLAKTVDEYNVSLAKEKALEKEIAEIEAQGGNASAQKEELTKTKRNTTRLGNQAIKNNTEGMLTESAKNKIKNREETSINKAFSVHGNKEQKDVIKNYEKAEQTIKECGEAVKATKDEITKLTGTEEEMAKAAEQFRGFGEDFSSETSSIDKMNDSLHESSTEVDQLTSRQEKIDKMKTSMLGFFSIDNASRLFRQALSNAVQTIKDLDAAMTETAVVTDYTVSDMWDQLDEYTSIANELGATTQGAYETMTLFFQQGLDANSAFEVGTETMKMARIAGMDYADTTDAMTAALRGFNMELNETSATRINDVYSKLAAVTASDTQEISEAMSKTASLADSVGMDFETTATYLAEAIETTREAPENIGTAMKTIAARYASLTQDPATLSEEMQDALDGESVDVNVVTSALSAAGISALDATGSFRDLGDIFLELNEKWDTLSSMQQRYIATQFAGSRQQSRFIAMMQNYERTTELLGDAYNSSGASQEQFDKTLESMESILNELSNAWNNFTMGILNADWLKTAIKALTELITVLDKVTSVFGDFGGALAKVGMGIGVLKIGRVAGETLTKGFQDGLHGMDKWGDLFRENLSKNFNTNFTDSLFGKIRTEDTKKKIKDMLHGFDEEMDKSGLFGDDRTNVSKMYEEKINKFNNASKEEQLKMKKDAGLRRGANAEEYALKKTQEEGMKSQRARKNEYNAKVQKYKENKQKKLDEYDAERKLSKKDRISSEKNKVRKDNLNKKAAEEEQKNQEKLRKKQEGAKKSGKQLGSDEVYLNNLRKESKAKLMEAGASEKEAEAAMKSAEAKAQEAAAAKADAHAKKGDAAANVADASSETANTAATKVNTEAENQSRLSKIKNTAATKLNSFAEGESKVAKLMTTLYTKIETTAEDENTAATIQNTIAKKAKIVIDKIAAKFALSSAAATLVAVAALLLAVAVIVGLVVLIKQLIKLSPEHKIETANEAMEGLSSAISTASQNLSEFKSQMDSFNTAVDQLHNLQKGTSDYTAALAEANSQLAQMAEIYPDIYEYVDWENGEPSISAENVEKIEMDLQDKTNAATSAQMVTSGINSYYESKQANSELVSLRIDEANTEALYGDNEEYSGRIVEAKADVAQKEAEVASKQASADSTIKNGLMSAMDDEYSAEVRKAVANTVDAETAEQKARDATSGMTKKQLRKEYADKYGVDYDETESMSKDALRLAVGADAMVDSLNETAQKITSSMADMDFSKISDELSIFEQQDLADAFTNLVTGVQLTEDQLEALGDLDFENADDFEDALTDAGMNLTEFEAATGKSAEELWNLAAGAKAAREFLTKDGTEGLGIDLDNYSEEAQNMMEDIAKDYYNEETGEYDKEGAKERFKNLTLEDLEGFSDSDINQLVEDDLISNNKTYFKGNDENFVKYMDEAASEGGYTTASDNKDVLYGDLLEKGLSEEDLQGLDLTALKAKWYEEMTGLNSSSTIDELAIGRNNFGDTLTSSESKIDEAKEFSEMDDETYQASEESYLNAHSGEMEARQEEYAKNHGLEADDEETIAAVTEEYKKLHAEQVLVQSATDDLNELFTDNADALDKTSVSAKEYAENLARTKKDLKKLGKGFEDLTDDQLTEFIEENDELISLYAQGEASIGDLGAAYVKYAKTQNLFGDGTEKTTKQLEEAGVDFDAVAQQIQDLPEGKTIEVGTETDTSALGVLYTQLLSLGYSAEEAAAQISAIPGIKASVKTETITVYDEKDQPIGSKKVKVLNVEKEDTGSGYTPSGDSGSGSSGGGSNSSYENEYDKQYNLLEKINAELRKREKLERKYQKLLKSNTVSISKLKANIEAQRTSLETTISQNTTLKSRKNKEINSLLSSKKYKKIASKYGIGYDSKTGAIKINYSKINKVKSESTGEKIDDLVSKLEELRDQVQDAEDDIADAEDTLQDIQDEIRDTSIDFKNTVKDALVDQYQEEIDKLSEIGDAIDDANQKLIDAIQSELEKDRQKRENKDTEDELLKKQRRLAYLRQDTSGANASEIKSLEEELQDAQQDYSDSLVDQAIDNMSEAYDKASEQREEQIELLENQLDYMDKFGYLWAEVYALIASGGKESLDPNSALGQLLTGSLKDVSLEEFQKNWQEYGSNYGLTRAGESNKGDKESANTTMIGANGETSSTSKEGEWTGDDTFKADGVTYNDAYKDQYGRIHYNSTTETSSSKKTKNSKISYKTETTKGVDENGNDISGTKTKYSLKAGAKIYVNGKAHTLKYADSYWVDDKGGSKGYIYDKPNRYSGVKINKKTGKITATELLTFSKPSGWKKNRKVSEMNKNQVYSLQRALANIKDGDNPYYNTSPKNWNGEDRDKVATALKKFQKDQLGEDNATGTVESKTKNAFKAKKYKTGGIADYTGPAWLDGTPSKPELVLNAQDTANFIQLKDTLSNLKKNDQSINQTNGDTYLEFSINVDKLESDYDVDKVADRVKQIISNESSLRNVNILTRTR